MTASEKYKRSARRDAYHGSYYASPFWKTLTPYEQYLVNYRGLATEDDAIGLNDLAELVDIPSEQISAWEKTDLLKVVNYLKQTDEPRFYRWQRMIALSLKKLNDEQLALVTALEQEKKSRENSNLVAGKTQRYVYMKSLGVNSPEEDLGDWREQAKNSLPENIVQQLESWEASQR